MIMMFKFVAYFTLAVLACFTTAFLSKYLPYAAESFEPLNLLISQNRTITPKNTTRRLQYLNDLVEMPIVGTLFLEEKILELVHLNKFNESLR